MAAVAAAPLTAASCGAESNCACSSRVATAAGADARRGGDTEFPCPGYGPANRCSVVPSSNPSNRGVTNMQPGGEHVRGVNPVLPYSTDDNAAILPYDTGEARTGAGGGVTGSSPATPQP